MASLFALSQWSKIGHSKVNASLFLIPLITSINTPDQLYPGNTPQIEPVTGVTVLLTQFYPLFLFLRCLHSV